MSARFHLFRICYSILVIVVVASIFVRFSEKVETAKYQEQYNEYLQNFDIRTDQTSISLDRLKMLRSQSNQPFAENTNGAEGLAKALEDFQTANSLSKIELNDKSKLPEIISPGGYDFRDADRKDRIKTLKSFLNNNHVLFGLDQNQIENLDLVSKYQNSDGTLSFVRLAQRINQIPVFQGEVKAAFTEQDEIIRIINSLAAQLDYGRLSEDFGTPQNAVLNAARHIGVSANVNDTIPVNSADLKTTFEQGQFSDKTIAEKFYFPIQSGVALPA